MAGDAPVDNMDVDAFVSPDGPDTTTIVANWYPFEEPNGGPNFYPWATDAHYDINNNGDARADLNLPVHVPHAGSSRQLDVPLQQRPGDLAGRREPAVPPDLPA